MALTVVQSKDASGTGTSISITTSSAVTAGNLLIVGIETGIGNSFVSGPVGNGNPYNLRFNVQGGNNFGQISYFDVPSANAGVTTITATVALSLFWDIFVYEVNNSVAGQVWNFDSRVSSSFGTGTALTSGSITNSAATEILIGFGTVANAVTAGTAGWTFVVTAGGDGREFLITSATGPNAATFTQGVSGLWLASIGGWYPAAPVVGQSILNSLIGPYNFWGGGFN